MVEIYCGTRSFTEVAVFNYLDGAVRKIEPEPSLAVRDHSPDGFGWGHNGSGPAQTALALLLDATGDIATAERLYEEFKRDFVTRFGKEWELKAQTIRDWVAARPAPGKTT